MGDSDPRHGSEDPFEDLDHFFASIEAVQWPEDPRIRTEPSPDAERRAAAKPAPTAAGVDDLIDLSAEAEPESVAASGPATAGDDQDDRDWGRLRDVLGEDGPIELPLDEDPPAIQLEDDDAFDLERGYVPVRRERVLSGTAQSRSGRSSARGDVGGPGGIVRAAAEQPGSVTGEGPSSPTAQTESGDRGGPGDHAAAPPTPAVPVPPAPRTPSPADAIDDDMASSWPEPDLEEEPGGLTLEDLKKAPPEYRDLPGPRPAAMADDRSGSVSPTPARQDPRSADDDAKPRDGVGESTPSLAEVEAMADSLAREFRSPADAVDEAPAVPADVEVREPARSANAPFDDDLLGDFEPPEQPAPAPRSAPRTVKVGAPEDLMGPAWEDPTARTVTREPVPAPQRGSERDMPMAIVTAAILVAAALLSIALAPLAFAFVAGIVILIALAEFYAAAHRQGYHPATLLGLVAGAMVIGAAYYHGEAGMLFTIVLSAAATFLWFMATPPKARTDVIANAGVTLFGLLYIPVTGAYYMVILRTVGRSPRALVLAILGLTFLYDVSAFFIGRYWGRHPLAPTISPKKSVQGLVGATFVTLLVASVLPRSFGPFNAELKLFALGLVVVIFAPLGDLAESLLKRDLGVKDMGSILPGHGGMLDRIDSALLVAPAVFYLIRLIG